MTATTPRRGFNGDPRAFRERYQEVFSEFFHSGDLEALRERAAACKAQPAGRSRRELQSLLGEAAAAEEAAIAIEIDQLPDEELHAEYHLQRSTRVHTPRRRVTIWLWERRRKARDAQFSQPASR